MNELNKRRRYKWCWDGRGWEEEQWMSVVRSDENRFTLFGNDGPVNVRCQPRKKYDANYFIPRVQHGDNGVMVCGCFTYNKLGRWWVDSTMNTDEYQSILGKHVVPFLKGEDSERLIFQQDNTPHIKLNLQCRSWRITKSMCCYDLPVLQIWIPSKTCEAKRKKQYAAAHLAQTQRWRSSTRY